MPHKERGGEGEGRGGEGEDRTETGISSSLISYMTQVQTLPLFLKKHYKSEKNREKKKKLTLREHIS